MAATPSDRKLTNAVEPTCCRRNAAREGWRRRKAFGSAAHVTFMQR
jgi:hypothetical protein